MKANVTSRDIYKESKYYARFSKEQGDITSKRTWGQPLKIVMAIIDKRCPECDTSTNSELRLDLGKENGKIFGGLCFKCGFRFSNVD